MLQHTELKNGRVWAPIIGVAWAVMVACAIMLTNNWGIPVMVVSIALLVVRLRVPFAAAEGRLHQWGSGISAGILSVVVVLSALTSVDREWLAGLALLSSVPPLVEIAAHVRRVASMIDGLLVAARIALGGSISYSGTSQGRRWAVRHARPHH